MRTVLGWITVGILVMVMAAALCGILMAWQSTPKSLDAPKRHLASITLTRDTLSWTVAVEGSKDESYLITLADAVMSKDKETPRKIDPDEVDMIRQVSGWLAKYAVASVAWWDDGEGEQVKPESDKQVASAR